jgi:acetoin utilization deacetylase AcuC-like enzyme
MQKYKLIYERLKEEGFSDEEFVEPSLAKPEDILLVHTEDYFKKIKEGKLSLQEELTLEIPYSKQLAYAAMLSCGGSILACQLAAKEKIAIHIGGGFHHAYPDHGEGFCVFNDIAIALRKNQKEGIINKALVIDCDLHQGNGTAKILEGDDSVFTFSIHEEDNYPLHKEKSSCDIGLDYGCDDEEYMKHLKETLPKIVKENNFDMICYVAGADPYIEDQLGHLNLTMEGLKLRDEFIFNLAKDNNIGIFVVLGGGYAVKVEDVVTIHCNMIKKAKEIFSK